MIGRIALAVSLLVGANSAVAQSSVDVGSIPPSAMVHTLDGKAMDLAKVAKGPAVIEFWATWCENCEHLLPAMKKAAATYGSKVKFIAVAVSVNQSVNRVKLHVAKHGVPGEQFFDTNGDATGKWDVPATSYVVVLDKKGKIVYTGVGGDQNIEAAIRKAL
ncbi:MAG: TlpA disulfide reductase family protein [Gemmatimonadaceae bacterium]